MPGSDRFSSKCPPSQIHARQSWIAITYNRRSRSHRLEVDRRRAHSLPLVAIVGKDLLEGIPSELSRRLVRLKEEKGEASRIQPNETMTKEQERKSTTIRRFSSKSRRAANLGAGLK